MGNGANQPWWSGASILGRVRLHAHVLGVAAVFTVLTGVVWNWQRGHATQALRDQQQWAAGEIAAAVEKRLERSRQLLQFSRGFFESSRRVSRAEWRWFVDGTQLAESSPGVIGLAYVEIVEPGFGDAFVRELEMEGVHGVQIHAGAAADDPNHEGPCYVIKYHEPASQNRRAWGLDIAADTKNRVVYDEAVATGEARLSPPFPLAQFEDTDRVGMVMCLPVHFTAAQGHNAEWLRAKQRGWVAAAIDFDELVSRSWDEAWNGLVLRIEPAGPGDQPGVIYRRETEQVAHAGLLSGRVTDEIVLTRSWFGQDVEISVAPTGADWTLPDMTRANVSLVIGLLTTASLSLFVWGLTRTRAKAVRLAREMTESLRVSEQRQRELATRAEQANLAKSEFLANMSHEIRTPMTAILGYADLLDDADSRMSRVEIVGAIRRAGRHLLTIINDVLDLSKIEAGRLEINPVETELGPVVQDVIDGFRGQAERRGISIELEVEGRLPASVRTDPFRVRQVLINLVGNAVKFTHEGGVRLVIGHEGSTLRFRVIDTGVGIEPDQIDRIFRPFEQADNSSTRSHEGTGLGLAISRKLAAMLEGSLRVHSVPGKGSEFVFEIPCVPAAGTAWISRLDASDHTPSPAAHRGGSLRGRVLLAEDGADNQKLISFFLERAGLEVTVVSNGREAIDAISVDASFDLLITDMQMPVLDGYTAASCLREMGSTIPILALTAHAMSGDRERCLAAGCDDYEPKPIDRVSLLRTVERLLTEPPARRVA